MLQIIKENKAYFLFFLLAAIVGGILLILTQQGDVILFFSDHRSRFGDAFFSYFTKMGEEIIYIVSIVVLLLYRFRYALLIPMMAILVTVISFASKSFFLHPRPSIFFSTDNFLEQINLIEGVKLLSAHNSFPSGHTMSAFAMYGLLALMLPSKKGWGILFFGMALLVGISRMYLVQHFLKDVVAGAIVGTLLALLVFYLQSRIPYSPDRFLDKGLLEIIRGKKSRARA